MNTHQLQAAVESEVRTFLSLLHRPGDTFEIRIPINNKYKSTASGYFDDVDAAVKAVARWDGRENIFVTLNPACPALLARAANRIADRANNATADADVVQRHWLFIDVDANRPSGISSTDEELAAAGNLAGAIVSHLANLGWSAPIRVMSGNGAYLLYRIDLTNDASATELIRQVLERLAARFDTEEAHVDTGVHNAARIIGLVGTLKMKGDPMPDRPHRRSALVEMPDKIVVVAPEQLEAIAQGYKCGPTITATSGSAALANILAEHSIEFQEQPPDANGVTWYHVRQCPLHEDGRPFECGVGQALPDGPYAGHCFHPEGVGKGWQDFKRALGLKVGHAHDPAIVSPEVPQIIVTNRHLHDLAADSWGAIQRTNEPPRLFLHGLDIGEIVKDASGRNSIRHLSIAGLRGRLDRSAEFLKVSTKGELSPARPPKDVVEDMLALEKPLPPLKGIVGVPAFASDGALDCTPGYQARTHLFYVPDGEPIPPVPDVPDATDLKRAKTYLHQEWLADYPFLDDASFAHAIAIPLTVMVREMIDGPTPLFAIDAPAPGSGKGLLASGVGIIVSGREAAVMTETSGEEERKRLTALVKAGHALLQLDNVKKKVASASFAALLTAPYWSDRLLGATQDVDMPVRGVWMATGNNMQFDSDISRRTVWIRIDARVDRPWEREGFRKENLLLWVKRHRHELVWACLVLVQNWIASRRPPWTGKTLGSFESWCMVLGGIFTSAGIGGFLENRQALYSRADSETEEWRALTRRWLAAHGTTSVKSRELLDIAQNLLPSVFERARDNASERALLTRLGRALSQHRDRSFDGIFIRQAGEDSHDGGALWRLECGTSPHSDGTTSAEVPQDLHPPADTNADVAELAEPVSGLDPNFLQECPPEREAIARPKQHPQVPQVPQTDSKQLGIPADVVRNLAPQSDEVPQCRRCQQTLDATSSNLCKGCRRDALQRVMEGQK